MTFGKKNKGKGKGPAENVPEEGVPKEEEKIEDSEVGSEEGAPEEGAAPADEGTADPEPETEEVPEEEPEEDTPPPSADGKGKRISVSQYFGKTIGTSEGAVKVGKKGEIDPEGVKILEKHPRFRKMIQ